MSPDDMPHVDSPPPSPKRTTGQIRVGVNFNPSGRPEVNDVKNVTAQLIDNCLRLNTRSASIAATHFETACMFAVKALTTGE